MYRYIAVECETRYCTSVLPVSYLTSVLPVSYQSLTKVLPKSYQSLTKVLPKSYQSLRVALNVGVVMRQDTHEAIQIGLGGGLDNEALILREVHEGSGRAFRKPLLGGLRARESRKIIGRL